MPYSCAWLWLLLSNAFGEMWRGNKGKAKQSYRESEAVDRSSIEQRASNREHRTERHTVKHQRKGTVIGDKGQLHAMAVVGRDGSVETIMGK